MLFYGSTHGNRRQQQARLTLCIRSSLPNMRYTPFWEYQWLVCTALIDALVRGMSPRYFEYNTSPEAFMILQYLRLVLEKLYSDEPVEYTSFGLFHLTRRNLLDFLWALIHIPDGLVDPEFDAQVERVTCEVEHRLSMFHSRPQPAAGRPPIPFRRYPLLTFNILTETR